MDCSSNRAIVGIQLPIKTLEVKTKVHEDR